MTPNTPEISAELVVRAYTRGAFPMADPETGRIDWYCPEPRAILPIDDPPGGPEGMRASRSLAKRVRSGRFRVTFDRDFAGVIRGCAAPGPGRDETWIDTSIMRVFEELHGMGLAHSVEAYDAEAHDAKPRGADTATKRGGEPGLLGGIYGLALGGAFFAESMFSRETDASKVCLYHLAQALHAAGYALCDVQFQNDHIKQFGVIEIPRDAYLSRLDAALRLSPSPLGAHGLARRRRSGDTPC